MRTIPRDCADSSTVSPPDQAGHSARPFAKISENHVSLRPLLDPKSVASLTGINGARAEIDDRFICARWRKQKFVEGVTESTKGAAMSGIVDNPFVVFAAFLVAQWIAAYLGDFVRLPPAAG